MQDRNYMIGILFACIGAVGFSLKAIFIKLAYEYHVDAETLLALRMLYSLPFFIGMLLLLRRKKQVVLSNKDKFLLVILGFFGYYLSSYLDFLGLVYISATLERLLLFVYPTFVIILSRIFLKKPIPLRFLPAIFLSYAGVVIVILGESSLIGSSSNIGLGSLLVLLSSLSYALYLMITGEIVHKVGSLAMVAYASTAACFFSLAQFFILKPPSLLINQPMEVHFLGLCIALFSTVVPIWLLAEAISKIGASLASIIGTLGPIFTIVFAIIFLGEVLDVYQFIGAVLIIVGVLLATMKPRPKNIDPEPSSS